MHVIEMHSTKRVIAVLFAVVVATSALSGCAFVARTGQRATGLQSNAGATHGPTLSTDGRYAVFGSDATNLVPGDTNGVTDAFIHDRNTGVTERVSVSGTEVEGNDSVDDFSVSDTGDVVAFSSSATNLDPNCTNAQWQIFVRTRSTGTTECISVDGNGVHGFGDSGEPHITAGGRLVVFDSEAGNLVAGDTNVAQDVFVRDLVTDTTERVNLKEDGTQSDGWAFWPDVSTDGRYVVYRTGFGDQDPACPPGPAAIILTDRKSDTNECLSVTPTGEVANGYADQPSISADGRYVTFYSTASNIDPACGPPPAPPAFPPSQVYVRDLSTDTTTCESVDSVGSQADTWALFPELSADGRTISFLSSATNLDPACTSTAPGAAEMFVRDLDTGVNTCVSVDVTGASGGSGSSGSLSGNGRLVAFTSYSALVTGDTNAAGDIHVRDIPGEVTTRVSNASVEPDADVSGPDLSEDGRYLAFSSGASNLVPDDTNGGRDVFRRDQGTGEVIRLSVATIVGIDFPASAGSRNPSISGNGNVVAFVSDASNLVTGDTANLTDIFVRDLDARTTTRASLGAGFVQANGASGEPAISANGRYIAFESTATNLDPTCTAPLTTVYVRDRTAGTTECFAPVLGGFRNQAAGSGPSISADGRYVALRSLAGGASALRGRGMDRRVGSHDGPRRLCRAGEQRRHHALGHAARVHFERRWSRPAVHERHRACVRRRVGGQHEFVRDRRPERGRRQRRQRRPVHLGRRSLRLIPYRGDEPHLPGRRQQRP